MTRIAITNGDKGGSTRRAATHYGRRLTANGVPTMEAVDGHTHVLEIPFSYANLPTYGVDKAIVTLPQYAKVESATFTVNTAFAGGTSFQVGLATPAGSVLDADGLLTTANLPLASINAIGAVVVGSGALIGTTLAAEQCVTVAATGTFTAGEALLRVVFTPKLDRLDNLNG